MTLRGHYGYLAACALMVILTVAFWGVALPALLRSAGA